MSIHLKTDYSSLFSSLFSSRNKTNSSYNNFLADYASIKNGSYGKLMKAYYAKTSSSDKTTSGNAASSLAGTSTSSDSSETLAKIQSSTDSLKESADALLETGSKSVFKKDDIDAAYKAVSSFVKNYNSVIETAGNANTPSILQKTLTMVNATKANEKLLGNIGITVGTDNKLSLDEETFKAANKTTMKTLFNQTGSYAYNVSASASFINFKADMEATKANTYSNAGFYNNNYTSGSIFSSYF